MNNEYEQIKAEKNLDKMKIFKKNLQEWISNEVLNYHMGGGYHTEMTMKDIKKSM